MINNIKEVQGLVNRLAQGLPKRKRRRFLTGVLALSLQSFTSLNQVGRSLTDKAGTGLSRVGRLMADAELNSLLSKVLIKHLFKTLRGRVWLNIDHSTFSCLTVATVGLQTGAGRSLPFWFQINFGCSAARIKPLVAALPELIETIREVNPKLEIVLVGDRWFGSETLMKFCFEHDLFFLFRTKTDKKVEAPIGKLPIDEIADYDVKITYRGLCLRLIISKLPKGVKEPWFLLTNLFDMSRNKLIRRYRYRWEIETAFKDLKWVFCFKKTRVKTISSLANLLLFAALGWYLAYSLTYIFSGGLKFFKQKNVTNPKKALSWFRQIFEKHLMPIGIIWRYQLLLNLK